MRNCGYLMNLSATDYRCPDEEACLSIGTTKEGKTFAALGCETCPYRIDDEGNVRTKPASPEEIAEWED